MELVVMNVNEGYTRGMEYLMKYGKEESSRNGRVVVAPDPVLTTYYCPTERVLFSPERDANPFFHMMECLWMLAGRNDAEFLVRYNKRMSEYSNEDGTYDGAYGFRWRKHFGFDQLEYIIRMLKDDPTTRRAVLIMFDPVYDLGVESKDIPCNTQIYFDLRQGKLNMTVTNRSNDAVWGCYGANAVHMSFLQEVIASMVGAQVGLYRQFSNNLHYYPDAPRMDIILAHPRSDDLYYENYWAPMPVVSHPECWFSDLEMYLEGSKSESLSNTFFPLVVTHMQTAWDMYKAGCTMEAIKVAEHIRDPAWRYVCEEWLKRRLK